jgi:isopenicillin N synthase-like dioxygenase
MGKIPFIDISKLRHGSESEKSNVITMMKAALTGPGFMYLTNSGIDPGPLLEDMHMFFARPVEEKEKYAWADPTENSGYVRIGGEGLDEDSVAGDPKESYEMNKEHMLASEVWSNSSAVAYWKTTDQLKTDLLEGYAMALGIDPKFFVEPHSEEWNTLRLLHYPGVFSNETYRVGPHSDYGTITLLVQDKVGGLQVLDRVSGRWVDVPPVENTVVANTADLLMRWTNDRFPSTLHRVVGPGATDCTDNLKVMASADRYSIVMFNNPNRGQTVENLIDSEKPRYPPVKALDYLVQRLSSTFDEDLGGTKEYENNGEGDQEAHVKPPSGASRQREL